MRIFEFRYIAALGYVIDTLESKLIYCYSEDPEQKFNKTMDKPVLHDEIMELIDNSDAPYESNDFVSCAKVAQVTL